MKKLLFGFIGAIAIFVFYMFFWVIFKNPHRMVDCYFGKNNQYVVTIERNLCVTAYKEIEQ